VHAIQPSKAARRKQLNEHSASIVELISNIMMNVVNMSFIVSFLLLLCKKPSKLGAKLGGVSEMDPPN
jgi:hypothetical protein